MTTPDEYPIPTGTTRDQLLNMVYQIVAGIRDQLDALSTLAPATHQRGRPAGSCATRAQRHTNPQLSIFSAYYASATALLLLEQEPFPHPGTVGTPMHDQNRLAAVNQARALMPFDGDTAFDDIAVEVKNATARRVTINGRRERFRDHYDGVAALKAGPLGGFICYCYRRNPTLAIQLLKWITNGTGPAIVKKELDSLVADGTTYDYKYDAAGNQLINPNTGKVVREVIESGLTVSQGQRRLLRLWQELGGSILPVLPLLPDPLPLIRGEISVDDLDDPSALDDLLNKL